LVATRADLQMSAFPCHELTVRNRRDPLVIRTIDDVEILTQMPESSQGERCRTDARRIRRETVQRAQFFANPGS
jgi:hypothetical protein